MGFVGEKLTNIVLIEYVVCSNFFPDIDDCISIL